MENPLLKLPGELQHMLLGYLDPDDALILQQVFDDFPINWMDVTKRHRNNMLENNAFCTKLRPDVRESRTPPGLRPSASSGLPRHRTYADLLNDPAFPQDIVWNKRQVDLEQLRDSLLFQSKGFRDGLDVPSEDAKEAMDILEANSSTYAQLLSQAHNYKDRRSLLSWRIRDERNNRIFQEEQLQGIICKMQAEPTFLPRTCRRCFAHTVKKGDGAEYELLHGVVYCSPCSRAWTATGPIRMFNAGHYAP